MISLTVLVVVLGLGWACVKAWNWTVALLRAKPQLPAAIEAFGE